MQSGPQVSDRQPIFDGQSDFSGGMDASRSPELIAQNQYALGVNITVRGNYPTTRPPFLQRTLNFSGDTDAQEYWNSNLFQGAAYYNLSGFFPCIVASVGGHIFNLQPTGNSFVVSDITPNKADGTLDVNSSTQTKAYFCVAATYLIIQDGQSLPFIYDGSTIRRSNPSVPEVPVGTVMAYGQGRLTVGDGNQFLVGDIFGGATNVISFTETTYLNGGGAFMLPMNMGNITGMIFNSQQDTDTGQGTLLVYGQTGVISVNLTIPRTQWQTTQIVAVTLTNIGTLSDRSLATINADILFRCQDGIRSYRDARAEFGTYSVGNFGQTSMSFEIQQWLDSDFEQWLPFTSGIVFDNRYLVTTLPTMPTYGVPVFQALAVMDFVTVAALRYQQPPVFDGFWTGLNFYQLVTGTFFSGQRGFAFARGLDNVGNQELQLWEIGTAVDAAPNPDCPIQCAIESKSFVFGNNLTFKRLEYLRHWADQLQGRVDWTLRLKPDQFPSWVPWQSWTDKAKVVTCQNTSCAPPCLQPQYRAGKNSTLAPEACITDGRFLSLVRDAFTFQVRIEWSGVARLTKLLFSAQPQDIPKEFCLTQAPPENPLTFILSGVPSFNQFFNTAITYDCPAGTAGGPVTVEAGTFSSSISVADANAAALASAIQQANCQSLRPTVTSATVNIGAALAFSYQIEATNSQTSTSYGATNLPSGLSVNTSTGVISGTTPATSGTYTIGLSATNPAGTGNGTLTLKVYATWIDVTFPVATLGGTALAAPVAHISTDGSAPILAVAGTAYRAFGTYQVTIPNYSWVPSGGASIALLQPIQLKIGAGGNVTLIAGTTGTMTTTSGISGNLGSRINTPIGFASPTQVPSNVTATYATPNVLNPLIANTTYSSGTYQYQATSQPTFNGDSVTTNLTDTVIFTP